MSKPGQAAEEEDARELKLGEDFVKAKCLMNAEVALILQRKYEQLQSFSEDAPNQISQVFEKSLQYVKRFSHYQNPNAVKQVRDVLSRNQLAEFESTLWIALIVGCAISWFVMFGTYKRMLWISILEVVCVIGNLCPETVEEAKALVPSIAKKGRMDDEKIEQMIADLATIKTFE